MYLLIKFLEIEKHLYVSYNKTLSEAQDVACITYLFKNIHLTTAELCTYVDSRHEVFQSIDSIVENYTPITTDRFLEIFYFVLPYVLLKDFIKEPLLADNPGNILSYISCLLRNNSSILELESDLKVLTNLLNDAFDRLLMHPDVYKDAYTNYYTESSYGELKGFDEMVQANKDCSSDYKKIITCLRESIDKVKDHYTKISPRVHINPILVAYSNKLGSDSELEVTTSSEVESYAEDKLKLLQI